MLIAAIGITVAWRRATAAAGTLADLTEAVVDLHGRTLAEFLGLECPQPFDRETGSRITTLLRKGA
ncbi:hypothetical protein [Amycolatopsis sp. lyj-90]|uniref:hypothetical protein n=1 Tax=Amycolatopsis sp. lyj-90 TaxID=2789285 RepID=UPI00397AD212